MANPLITCVSGLSAHQKMIEVIGNNIANMNSTAFKTSRVFFSDIYYETVNSGTPSQVGTGSKVATISVDTAQGNLETTGRKFDLAIDGQGYFVVDSEVGPLYTRSGVLSVDQQGYLVDSSTGFRVQRYGTVGEPDGANPSFQVPGSSNISIPIGAALPGSMTSLATLRGNLPSTTRAATQQILTTSNRLLTGGVSATGATLLNSLDFNTSPYGPGDTIDISGVDADGTVISGSLAVDGTTTLDDLITMLNSLYTGATAALNIDGELTLTANETGTSPLTMTLSDNPANIGGSNFSGNPMATTVLGRAGQLIQGGIEVFDARGDGHLVGLAFELQPDGTWNMQASLDSAEGDLLIGDVSGISFNPDGSFAGISGGGAAILSVRFAGQTDAQVIDLSFGETGSLSGLRSISGESSLSAEQDGYASGTLASVNIDGRGVITGLGTNGRQIPLAQIAIATFRNPAGLESLGNGMSRATLASGDVELGTGESGGRGSIRSGQLEQSNVDLAAEFTRLIIAQRGFSANARSISVADEMLQELTQLLR